MKESLYQGPRLPLTNRQPKLCSADNDTAITQGTAPSLWPSLDIERIQREVVEDTISCLYMPAYLTSATDMRAACKYIARIQHKGIYLFG